jgi:uncharacterized damage-inducible protein DinB
MLKQIHIMTLHEIRVLFEYDRWANDRTLESISSVPEPKYLEDLKSSHGGIHGTLVYIYGVNMVWLQRWKGGSPMKFAFVAEVPNLEALKNHWMNYQTELDNYLNSLSEAMLIAPLSYSDYKGNSHSEQLFQQMQHRINHSSYHRGQIVTMLRQIDSVPIGTDLITFYRRDCSP